MTQYAEDDCGDHITRWMVEPPAMGENFRVTKEEWDEDLTYRYILDWEPA